MTAAPLMNHLLPQLAIQIPLCSICASLYPALIPPPVPDPQPPYRGSPVSLISAGYDICRKQLPCSAQCILFVLQRPGLFDLPSPSFHGLLYVPQAMAIGPTLPNH